MDEPDHIADNKPDGKVKASLDEGANKLLSERHEEFIEALEILYIAENISGRIHFEQDWPQAASYMFGEDLIRFDTEGMANEDERAQRAELEAQAEEKRLKLLETAKTLEEKSVDTGALQIEYVESVVKDLGRDLALLLYAPQFVDRVIPPPPGEQKEEEPKQEQTPPEQAPVSSPQESVVPAPQEQALLPVELEIEEEPPAAAPETPQPVVSAEEAVPAEEAESGPVSFEDLKKLDDEPEEPDQKPPEER